MKKLIAILAFAMPFFANAQMCWLEEIFNPIEFTTVPNACITSYVISDDRVAFEGDVTTGGFETDVSFTIEVTDCAGYWDSVIYEEFITNTDNDIYHFHVTAEDYDPTLPHCYRFNLIAVNDIGNDTAVFGFIVPSETAPEVSINVNEDYYNECYFKVDFELESNHDESRFKYMIYTEFGDTIVNNVFNSPSEYDGDIEFTLYAPDYEGVQLFAKVAGKNDIGMDYDYVPFNFNIYEDGTCNVAFWREGEIWQENNFAIFPNPASDNVFVKNDQQGQLMVFSITGKFVAKYIVDPGVTEIDVSSLSRGTYLFRFVGEEKTFTQKVVKR